MEFELISRIADRKLKMTFKREAAGFEVKREKVEEGWVDRGRAMQPQGLSTRMG
jgi:hypothetical protein